MATRKRPGVGVGVFVTSKQHPGCVILGRRKGTSPGMGLFGLPGGHLEFGESWEDCAVREVIEETGLKIENVTFETVLNAVDVDNDYHYIEIFMKGEVRTDLKAEPENMEPHKCEGWEWVDWNKFPAADQLFRPMVMVRQEQYNPFKT